MLAIVRFLRSLSYIFSSCLPMAVQIMFPVGMRCTYFYWVMIVETLSGREEAQQIAVQPTGSGLLNTARSGIDSCCFALFDMTREKPFRPFPEGRRRNQLIGPHLSLIRPQPPSPRAVHVLHRFSSNCLSWISTFPIQLLAYPNSLFISSCISGQAMVYRSQSSNSRAARLSDTFKPRS